ncbi:MAG: response regulator, partial [Chloroflexi bacterium]|nr:response regulator [Chloroflexota bacterium]
MTPSQSSTAGDGTQMSLREFVGPSDSSAQPLSDIRVLVVEDDPGFRVAIEAALE